MPLSNQLSTVLLLVALGILIHYLTKSKHTNEGFAIEEEQKVLQIPRTTEENIVQEILAKSNTGSESQSESQSESRGESRGESRIKDDVLNFEGNDIDASNYGALLDSAFDKPIPKDLRTDMVDINKNNVKKYDSKDFLPKEINDEWFDTDFSQAKYNINDDKLINTERYVIGINTVGQSLKNASYDIRGTVPNPKYSVSPWNNSTYEPDFNIKPLC